MIDFKLWRRWTSICERAISTGYAPILRRAGVRYGYDGCPLVRRGVSAKPLNKRERRFLDAIMERQINLPMDPHANRRNPL